MKLSEFAYLTDENIHPETVAFLRSRGVDVVDARDCGLAGADDAEILRVAFEAGRVVLTHDSDCGAWPSRPVSLSRGFSTFVRGRWQPLWMPI